MEILKNDLLLRAARGEKTERTPIWLMRQAGRILPQYRKLREKLKDFKELVKTPEAACEATLQPIDILGVDAAIIFSDILVVPEAMGLPYQMIESKGPWFEKKIENFEDIQKMRIANPREDLNYVLEAIRLTKKELNNRLPLVGFAGAPWTIFSYMVEGHGSKNFSKAKKMLYSQPDWSHELLKKITDSTVAYLKAQIRAGADIVQIFDSWAGDLNPALYREFALPYINSICNEIYEAPIIVFARGAYFARTDLANLKCSVIGLDWTMDIKESRSLIGYEKTLQGNMDPCLLYADYDVIKKATIKMLNQFGPEKYIANLGHGLQPDTDADKVKCFIDTVKAHRFQAQYV
jgi:uroporphyrinogen decarboxylase